MLRHIVMVIFKAEATPAQRDGWRAAVVEMCETSPEVLTFTLGTNVGSGPNHHDCALVADFADIASFRRHIDGPAHRAYVEQHARHVVARIAAIQHELDPVPRS